MGPPAGAGQILQMQGVKWGDPGQNELDSIYFDGGALVIDTRAPMKIGTGTISLGTGTPRALDIATGTAAAPVTTLGNTIRINRYESIASVQGGGAPDNSGNVALNVTSINSGTSVQQVAAILGTAQTNSTQAGADGLAVAGIGWAAGGSINHGIGGYFEGRRDQNTGKTNAAEFRSNNNTATAGVFSTSQLSDTASIWITAGGTASSAEALGIGGVNGQQFQYGLSFKSNLGPSTTSIRDDSSSTTSVDIRGTHTTGIEMSFGTFTTFPIRLPNNAGIWALNANGAASSQLLYLNGSNQAVLPAPTVIQGLATLQAGLTLSAGSNLTTDSSTASATAGAATLNKQSGTITSEALTTAAGSDYVLTLTNSVVTAASRVLATADNGTNTTEGLAINRVTPASGSVVIRVRNTHATTALNGTIKINFFVVL